MDRCDEYPKQLFHRKKMSSEQKSENLKKLPRLWHFVRKPSREKARWFAQKWREMISRIPKPVRLPFGAIFLSRKDALGFNLLEFETRELAFAGRFLRPGMTVLDIGANQGLYTLLAAQRVGSTGRVFAFEPSPRERRALRLNVMINFCMNVTVESSAIGDEEGDSDLFLVEGPETGCNSLRPPVIVDGTSRPLRVSITRLDRWVREHNIDRVDFIKLDVEGAELSVLKGATELLSRSPRPAILAEVANVRTAPWGYRASEIIVALERVGYNWFDLLPDGSLAPVSQIDQREMNLVAVPKERLDYALELTPHPN